MPGLVPENDLPSQASSAVPESDLPENKAVPDTDLPETRESKYGSLGQQALTGVEGVAQGLLTKPVATLAEKGLSKLGVPGLSDEDIKARAEENPITHGVGEYGALGASLIGGVGIPGLIERGAAMAVPKVLGRYGAAFVKNAITMGALRTGDKINDALLGQGDPNEPVSAAIAGDIVPAALFGGLFGVGTQAVGAVGGKALSKFANTEMAKKAQNYAIGMGIAENMRQLGRPIEEAEKYIEELNKASISNVAKEMLGESELIYKDVKPGIEVVRNAAKTLSGGVGSSIGSTIGSVGGIPGSVAGYEAGKKAGHSYLAPLVEKIIGKSISKPMRYVAPGVLKALSEGDTSALSDIAQYSKRIGDGAIKIDNAVNGLFKVGGKALMDFRATDKQRERMNDYLENGGLNTQLQQGNQPSNFAEGGEVQAQEDPVSKVFPEQSMLLSAAKARVFQYLNGKRPQPPQTIFPYDKHEPDKIQEKSYSRALDIANSPLSIFNHIKSGTIDQEHVQHLTSMYPELYKHLSNKIMQRIVQNKIDDEKPNYKIRMGLSLFLGQPMDSTMSPMQIQQAQACQVKPQQPAPRQNMKNSPSKMNGKAENLYKTAGQEAETDRSARD